MSEIVEVLKDTRNSYFHRYIVKEPLGSINGENYQNVLVTLDLDRAIKYYQNGTNRRIEIWLNDEIKVSEYWGDQNSFDEIKTTIIDYFY